MGNKKNDRGLIVLLYNRAIFTPTIWVLRMQIYSGWIDTIIDKKWGKKWLI